MSELKLQYPTKQGNVTNDDILNWLKNINKHPVTGKDITNDKKMYRFFASEALKRKLCYHPILQELAPEGDKKPLEDDVSKFKNNALIINVFKKYILYLNHLLKELPRATTPEIKKEKFGISRGRSIIMDAIKIIESLEVDMGKGEDIKSHKGIGKGTIARINEIIQTGKLEEMVDYEDTMNDDKIRDIAIIELKKVYGIGETTASKYYDEYNIKNIKDLQIAVDSHKIELTDAQIMGLKYYDDINTRISRDEIKEFDVYLNKLIHSIDVKLTVNIVGSYRRERPDSGDIDVLLTHKDYETNTFISDVISKFRDNGILLAVLSSGNTKFNGIIEVNGKARRIDIRFVPYENYYPALLYFTGSGNFNIEMRIKAKQLGYKLNEYHLYKLKTHKSLLPGKVASKKDIEDEVPVIVKSEKEIFDILSMDYLEPKDRERGKGHN
ncbi:hypothetical protein HN451_01530 [archaeon]|nr:hypothetical protein [archaeon]